MVPAGSFAGVLQSLMLWVVNWGFSPLGWPANPTITLPGGVQPVLQTWTVNVPDDPRLMLLAGWVTLTHSVAVGAVELEPGVGFGPDRWSVREADVAEAVEDGEPDFVVAGEPEFVPAGEPEFVLAGVVDGAPEEGVRDGDVEFDGWLAEVAGPAAVCEDVGDGVLAGGEDVAVARSRSAQALLVCGVAEPVMGAAFATPSGRMAPAIPAASKTPPLTTPTAIARTCTKHMKDRPVFPARRPPLRPSVRPGTRVPVPGRPEAAGFGTTYSYPLQRQLYLVAAQALDKSNRRESQHRRRISITN